MHALIPRDAPVTIIVFWLIFDSFVTTFLLASNLWGEPPAPQTCTRLSIPGRIEKKAADEGKVGLSALCLSILRHFADNEALGFWSAHCPLHGAAKRCLGALTGE